MLRKYEKEHKMLRKSEKVCCKLGKKCAKSFMPKKYMLKYIFGQFLGGGWGGVKVSLSTSEPLSKRNIFIHVQATVVVNILKSLIICYETVILSSGSISQTFYEQLLRTQIPKGQKDIDDLTVYLRFWDL
jgi:hypothetical protein